MKFSTITYERPDIEQVKATLKQCTQQFLAGNKAQQSAALETTQQVFKQYYGQLALAGVRHDLNTEDEFYKAEIEWGNMTTPIIAALEKDCYQALLKSPHLAALKKEFGTYFFEATALRQKISSEAIIVERQKNNQLTTAYEQFFAKAAIDFKGKNMPIAHLQAYFSDPDRTIRQQATQTYWAFVEQHQAYLDDLFDKLVKNRHQMALKMGYANYMEMSYLEHGRLEYGAKEVQQFRNQIKKEVVPFLLQLHERRQKRLNLDQLHYYDGSLTFLNGNPKPLQDIAIVEVAKKMYDSLSTDTAHFINYMINNELMDLTARQHKTFGGYNSGMILFNCSFIVANFNGTSDDVQTLIHELGHAFQHFQTMRHNPITAKISDLVFPTFDIAEIHSVGMEYLIWDNYELFFGEDADKYRFQKMAGELYGLTWDCLIDEFQQFVYEHPDCTAQERHAAYKRLRAIYRPYITERYYDDNHFLFAGNGWQDSYHIFVRPFYMIDYSLASISALQLWQQSRSDFEGTWTKYNQLCKLGGSLPFLTVLEKTGLQSPFEPGCVTNIVKMVKNWLNAVDDSTF